MTGPYGIAVDAGGTVYVTDRFNNRIDMLSDEGEFIARLGAEGTGPGKFKWGFPIGIAVAPKGNLWVTDSLSDRIQHWTIGADAQEAEAEFVLGDDPSVEVEVDGGLVESVEGEEAGEVSYGHDDDLLTSVDGPEGETGYDYDEEFNGDDRLSKVTLPNGTYGQIAYDAKGRVKSVTTSDEGGAPETTTFQYQDEPTRRTTVKRPKELPIVYDLGEDGSVFKSQSEKAPPGVVLSGSLFAAKETPSAIEPGDYELVVEASSPAADITSIEVIANGTTQVDEKTCEAPCPEEEDRWVTNTGSWSPGILYLEVLVTDSTNEVASKRFWVNIPYTPPPPEVEAAPTFAEIQKFREEFGLDLDIKGNERAINNRIFDLIWAWNHPGTPEGEIARATAERWGSPLRAVDAAELDYRIAYWQQASGAIPAWAAANASSTFAGFYIDERAGGVIRAGFTGDQSQVNSLRVGADLIVPASRMAGFPTVPQYSLAALESLRSQVSTFAASSQPRVISEARIDVKANKVNVGASNVSQATSQLNGAFGSGAPLIVTYQPNARDRKAGRERIEGPMRAGDLLRLLDRENGPVKEPELGSECTGAFGAFAQAKSPTTGQPVKRMFVLTAGHCMDIDHEVIRRADPSQAQKQWIGFVRREGVDGNSSSTDVDAAAIRLDNPDIVPRKIFTHEGQPRIPVTSIGIGPQVGTHICYSGITSNRERCGPILEPPAESYASETNARTVEICIGEYIEGGDSGSPAWIQGTGTAVGIMVTGFDETESSEPLACFEPLKPYPGWGPDSAVFTNDGMAPLHLVTGGP
jgi:YD repeat-containing protein